MKGRLCLSSKTLNYKNMNGVNVLASKIFFILIITSGKKMAKARMDTDLLFLSSQRELKQGGEDGQ